MLTSATNLDEPVHLSPWSSEWATIADALRGELSRALPLTCQIEHIGSTAVEGMLAKPIVDLMIGVRGAEDPELIARKLSAVGWQDMGEAGVPGRRHLRARSGAGNANVHIVRLGSAHWFNNIWIRDYLLAHPQERSAYVEAKQSALAAGPTGLLIYSDRKSDFMRALLERATAWSKRRAPRQKDEPGG